MKIVWDEAKRQLNLAKHGLDFADIPPDFLSTARIGLTHSKRNVAVGRFAGGLTVTVIYRPLGSEAISLVSLRPASRREREAQ